MKIRVGITMGDPAGIGAEIIRKALLKKTINRHADFTVIGDKNFFKTGRRFSVIDLKNVSQKDFQYGRISKRYGRASVEYIQKAVELISKNQIDCLVTCPISKEAVKLAGIRCPGHTELLAELCAVKDPLMLLVNDYLKFSLVTRHIPLKEVSQSLNKSEIYKNISSTHKALKGFFKIDRPRIVVLSLNPHASDGGILGREEKIKIAPVIKKAKKIFPYLDGPFPADTGISRLKNGLYDCAIAMYHDQALIPLKLTGAESAVNLTWGLPFVRTSPLHGTAFDIAGKNKASPASLISAIKLAIQCTRNLKNA